MPFFPEWKIFLKNLINNVKGLIFFIYFFSSSKMESNEDVIIIINVFKNLMLKFPLNFFGELGVQITHE